MNLKEIINKAEEKGSYLVSVSIKDKDKTERILIRRCYTKY